MDVSFFEHMLDVVANIRLVCFDDILHCGNLMQVERKLHSISIDLSMFVGSKYFLKYQDEH